MDNNNNNANKKPNKVNMPKFNLNWLYMIIAMMLLGLYKQYWNQKCLL